jgi:hypothetical protein
VRACVAVSAVSSASRSVETCESAGTGFGKLVFASVIAETIACPCLMTSGMRCESLSTTMVL